MRPKGEALLGKWETGRQMSKNETPMILAYWERIGGTLIEEFQLVKGDAACGPRRADAVIVLGQKRDRLPKGQRAVNIEGKTYS